MTAARTEARIVQNALVVSVPMATPPRLWRADLGHINTAAFEIKSAEGKFSVVMIRDGGAREEVAVFAKEAAAVEALSAIMSALTGDVAAAPVKKGFFRKLLKGGFYTLGIFLVLMVLIAVFGPSPPLPEQATPDKKLILPGKPVPADEFFKK